MASREDIKLFSDPSPAHINAVGRVTDGRRKTSYYIIYVHALYILVFKYYENVQRRFESTIERCITLLKKEGVGGRWRKDPLKLWILDGMTKTITFLLGSGWVAKLREDHGPRRLSPPIGRTIYVCALKKANRKFILVANNWKNNVSSLKKWWAKNQKTISSSFVDILMIFFVIARHIFRRQNHSENKTDIFWYFLLRNPSYAICFGIYKIL